MRKDNAYLELNLGRDAKDNKKGFFKYINIKRKTRENGGTPVEQGPWRQQMHRR